MNKIGILTLVSANNCGSQLQAFALRYVLEEQMHFDAELINFHPAFARKMYKLLHLNYFKHLLNFLCMLPALVRQQKSYDLFRKQYLKLESKDKLFDAVALYNNADKYRQIIVGSDQVWNVNMADFDEAYFLCGYNGCKVTYAASLGGGEKIIVPEKLKQFKLQINQFQNISVREPQGKGVLQKFIDNNVRVDVDPTLLVPEEKWIDLAGESIVNGEYIFYYSYNYGDEDLNILVQKAAKKLNLQVYVINASRWVAKNPRKYDFHLAPQEGPLAFLSLMKHAKLVFVQSLHGSIFAYIFKSNFWFLNNRENDVLDQRSENILNLLGKRDRTIRPNSFEGIDLSKPCVYGENHKLHAEKMKSLEYLKKVIN